MTEESEERERREAEVNALSREILGRIEHLILKMGAGPSFARNVATHVSNAVIISVRTYAATLETVKEGQEEYFEDAAFLQCCKVIFSKKYNQAVLPQEISRVIDEEKDQSAPCYG